MKKTIKVDNIDFSEMTTIVDLPDLALLETMIDSEDYLLEDTEAFFLLRAGFAFRVMKPDAKPETFKTLAFEASPDSFSAKVEVSPERLLTHALKNRLPIFETSSELLLPSPIFLWAKKSEKKATP